MMSKQVEEDSSEEITIINVSRVNQNPIRIKRINNLIEIISSDSKEDLSLLENECEELYIDKLKYEDGIKGEELNNENITTCSNEELCNKNVIMNNNEESNNKNITTYNNKNLSIDKDYNLNSQGLSRIEIKPIFSPNDCTNITSLSVDFLENKRVKLNTSTIITSQELTSSFTTMESNNKTITNIPYMSPVILKEDVIKENELKNKLSNERKIDLLIIENLKDLKNSKYICPSNTKILKTVLPLNILPIIEETGEDSNPTSKLEREIEIKPIKNNLEKIKAGQLLSENNTNGFFIIDKGIQKKDIIEKHNSEYAALEKNNLNQENSSVDYKHKIIIRDQDEEYVYYLKKNDTLEDILDEMGIRKVKHKGLMVSKYLTLDEIGLGQQDLYFDVIQEGSSDLTLKVNLDFFVVKNIKIEKNSKIREILVKCGKTTGVIVMNGYIIDTNKKVKDIFENNDVIDIIE